MIPSVCLDLLLSVPYCEFIVEKDYCVCFIIARLGPHVHCCNCLKLDSSDPLSIVSERPLTTRFCPCFCRTFTLCLLRRTLPRRQALAKTSLRDNRPCGGRFWVNERALGCLCCVPYFEYLETADKTIIELP